jgi:hypothetical protein
MGEAGRHLTERGETIAHLQALMLTRIFDHDAHLRRQ